MAFPPEDTRLPISSRLPRQPSRRQTPRLLTVRGRAPFPIPFTIDGCMNREGDRFTGGGPRRDDRGAAFHGRGNGYDPNAGAESGPAG